MSSDLFDESVLAAIVPLRAAGFGLHWLRAREKKPTGTDGIGTGWSTMPVATLDELQRSHRHGLNLGVRLGEYSLLETGDYLHVIDVDIRIPGLADECWEAFDRLLPGIRAHLPCVASGSGGESRHHYFVSDSAFDSRMLAVSDGKHRGTDGKWHHDWEIDLFGTSKQVAMPPSIHPDTGKPYRWEREFDLDALALGAGPFIPSAVLEACGVAETSTYEYETREPLEFKPGQLESTLDSIPVSDLDYDDWIRLGQALHHQFGAADEGFDLWLKHTKRSIKFTGDAQIREMRRSKWRSFGKYRRKPVTMATVVSWAQDARSAALGAEFDDLDDEPETTTGDSDFDDLITADADPDAWANAPEKPELDEDGQPASRVGLKWSELLTLLEVNEEGGIKPTLHNLEMIVKNDPRLVGLPQLNEFTQETMQRTPPGHKGARRRNPAKETRQLSGRVWRITDTLNGELWSDDRDFAIRSIIEAPKTQGGYGLKVSDRDLKASIVLAANDNAFHPVREFLEAQKWDRKPRVESFFTEYMGAAGDAYTRSVSRLMLVAAVTRIYEPGHKFDYAVILEGLQGKKKSTFISVLGKSWFAELDGDFHDPKQMVELMQGAWIMEIPELSGFGRADVRSIKAFISRQKDRARLAYARRAGAFPRQCIFIGSTNDKEYLKDDTGGRRFWPMECSVTEIDTDRLGRNVDQIWAEAVALYRAMRVTQPHGTLPLYLTDPEAKATAARLQESRRVESADDAMAGRIAAWLDKPVASGSIDDGDPAPRNETCLVQIWCEALDSDMRSYNQAVAQMLGRAMRLIPGWATTGSLTTFPNPYGRQRFYERGGIDGRHARMGLNPGK